MPVYARQFLLSYHNAISEPCRLSPLLIYFYYFLKIDLSERERMGGGAEEEEDKQTPH